MRQMLRLHFDDATIVFHLKPANDRNAQQLLDSVLLMICLKGSLAAWKIRRPNLTFHTSATRSLSSAISARNFIWSIRGLWQSKSVLVLFRIQLVSFA